MNQVDGNAGKTTFVWPPRDGQTSSQPSATPPLPARLPSNVPGGSSLDIEARTPRSWWSEFEHAWLGVTRAPFAERAIESGWMPDPPGRACVRCALTVGEFESDASGCPACAGKRLAWEHAVRLAEYEGLLRDAVLEVKFTAWRRLGRELGRLLGARLAADLEAAGVNPREIAIVPVPMSIWRRLGRGIDHSLAICRGVRDVTGAEIVHALHRRHRSPQTRLALSARARNVAGTMRVRSQAAALAGRDVVVIDDVRTTGATLGEACRALRAMGKKRSRSASAEDQIELPISPRRVWIAMVAVTPDPDRRRLQDLQIARVASDE